MRQSGLIIEVPDAEPVVAAFRLEMDPMARRGVPAHITVLFPFAPPERLGAALQDRLIHLFAAVPSFTLTLVRPAWFGEDVLWLAPEPECELRSLTQLMVSAFPEFPPYGGRFADIVPHLTVADGAPLHRMRSAERALARHLPIRTTANAVTLMAEQKSGQWVRVTAFPLG